MDSMDLEREKGITIQSAATFCTWGENHINIIDTPGHVDFTVEVERALRVLDGAVLVICAVSGVQSQTLTVDRQMKRYKVPRVAFINKLDRMGANPWKAIASLRKELRLPAAALQIPIGVESVHEGVVCLLTRTATIFSGDKGIILTTGPCPDELVELMEEKRTELIERLGEVDEDIAELFISEIDPTAEQLALSIRKHTIANSFVPVFMGSAYKNKGVQLLLNGVVDYLPSPPEVENIALDQSNNEAQVQLLCDPAKPLVALAFKLEESKFGQLTYLRMYQGTLKKGQMVVNMKTGKKIKIPRLVRMHSSEMQDVDTVSAGDVIACFGTECSSMDTFTDGNVNYSLISMFIPNAVMSLSIKPKDSQKSANFSKAIGKFTREDPTLRVTTDQKSKETIMSGMGELHLEIYVERMKREFDLECVTGNPAVNYKETIGQKAEFSYLHKKQSGGSGQYARVIGFIEPLDEEDKKKGIEFEFENRVIGTNIPPEYIPSCEKGAKAACEKGVLAGYPLSGVRVVITDGQAHAVDSNDLSFQLAMQYAIRQGFQSGNPSILEPQMLLEVTAPSEFQGSIIGGLNKRNGLIMNTDLNDDGSQINIKAEVPLSQMFGYSTDLRSSTQGKGEFAMDYKEHASVTRDSQEKLIKLYEERRALENE
jgi:elongation factor G